MENTYPWIFELLAWLVPTFTAISWREAIKVRLCNLRGDSTAHMVGLGSFSLSKHLDPIGSALAPLLMILRHKEYIYAWARASEIRSNFLKNGRYDVLLIVSCAILSNLMMACGWIGIIQIGKLMGNHAAASFLITSAEAGVKINLLLTIVHLIPLPPMDISLIVREYLPRYIKGFYRLFDPIGHFLIFAAIFFQTPFQTLFLEPAVHSLNTNLLQLLGLTL